MDFERLSRLAPVQARFGPTLPEVLVPRIDRLPAIARRVGAVALVIAAVVIVAVVLRSRDPVYHSPPGPATLRFSTSYPRTLKRVTPPPGSLLLLQQRDASGHLIASFEITPIRLPSYSGEISGLWPVYVWNYVQHLRSTLGAGVLEQSDGRTRIINTPAYTFSYSSTIGGRTYFGRVVFITRDLTGDRQGLALSMLITKTAMHAATHPIAPTPDQVGTVGVLFEPLERLRFG